MSYSSGRLAHPPHGARRAAAFGGTSRDPHYRCDGDGCTREVSCYTARGDGKKVRPW